MPAERRRRPHAQPTTGAPAPAQRTASSAPRGAARRGGFRFPGVGAWAALLVGAWVMRLLLVFPGIEQITDVVLIVLTATVAAAGWRYAARERLARARAPGARGSVGTR